ncbi:MAG: hypothetical protein EXR76_06570 [Myxococcales bacterium]|nr:hypothetical protein [Myxococcales bacterium]
MIARLLCLVGFCLVGCAQVVAADVDALVEDRGVSRGPDLRPLEPGETPRFDAALLPPSVAPTSPPDPDQGPSPATEPPLVPTAPPTDAPDPPDVPDPSAVPSAQPPEPDQGPPPATEPPPEPECRTDDDCGAADMLCFGTHCVIDPAAPHQVGEGACTNDADDTVMRENRRWRDVGSACGLACLGQMMQQPCVNACVVTQTGLSARCSGCYGAWVSCVGALCIIPCGFNDDAVDCAECRERLCDVPLEICGGFAAPLAW